MPVLSNVGKAALGQAVGFAKDVAGDLAEGRNIRQSLKQRGLKRLKNTAMDSLSNITGTRPRSSVTSLARPIGQTSLGKRRAARPRKQPPRKKPRQALF